MKQDLLEIINHYGVLNQLEYYQTEVWELNEAIIRYDIANADNTLEKYYIDESNKMKKHIAEELADNFVMLYQFKEYYKLDFELIKDFITFDSNPLRYLKIFVKDVYRLSKEIIEFECRNNEYYYSDEDRGDMELFMKDKLLIVLYKLKNIQAYYGITDEEIEEVMRFKIDRQKKRMEKEK